MKNIVWLLLSSVTTGIFIGLEPFRVFWIIGMLPAFFMIQTYFKIYNHQFENSFDKFPVPAMIFSSVIITLFSWLSIFSMLSEIIFNKHVYGTYSGKWFLKKEDVLDV